MTVISERVQIYRHAKLVGTEKFILITIIIIKAIRSFHCTNISFQILSFSVHKFVGLIGRILKVDSAKFR